MSVSYSLSQNNLLQRPDNTLIPDDSGIGSGGGYSGDSQSNGSGSVPVPNPDPSTRSDADGTGSTENRGDRGAGSSRNSGTSNPDGVFEGTSWTGDRRNNTDSFPIDIWQPNPDLSPSDNILGLQSWIDSLFNRYTALNPDDAFANFGNILTSIYSALSNSRNMDIRDLSDGATLQLAEKITDVMYSFINAQFNSAMAYQSWYLQQEYNSPVNQINRLAAAGLHSAFALGNVSAGNASSPAGVGSGGMSQPQNSGAGQVEQQAQASRLGFISNLITAGVSSLSAASSLINSVCVSKMNPLEISKANQEILESAANQKLIQTTIDQIGDNTALSNFDRILNASSQGLNAAKSAVELAQSQYDTAVNLGTQETTIDANRVLVEDKSGHQKWLDLDFNETDNFIKNGYRTDDGYSAVDTDALNFGGSLSYNPHGSVKVPGLFDVGADAKIEGHVDKKNSKSETKSKSKSESTDIGSGGKQGHQGYNDRGTQWRSGNTTFYGVKVRRKTTLPEHKEYIEQCRKRLQEASDRFDTLSTGEKARLDIALDSLIDSLKSFSARSVAAAYKTRIQALFEPKLIQGD